MEIRFSGSLLSWLNYLIWDLSIRRNSDVMLKDSRIAVLRTLLNIVTSLIFFHNLISDACICDRTLSVITQDSWPYVRMGSNIDLNAKIFVFFDSSRFKILQSFYHSTFFAGLNIQFFVLLFYHSWMRPQDTWISPLSSMILRQLAKKHWTRFLKKCSISVLEVLIFIPPILQTYNKAFNPCWWPDLEEGSKLNHLRKATD